VAEIAGNQHPDSIWTWPSKGGRAVIWLPYVQRFTKTPRKKHCWNIAYQGGTVDVDLGKSDFIMLYGDSEADIPLAFLDDLNASNVALAIHRRNQPRPLWFWPQSAMDRIDIVTDQVLARVNLSRRAYIARTLIAARIDSMGWIGRSYVSALRSLPKCRSVSAVRNIEAGASKQYWEAYFELAGTAGGVRRGDCALSRCLDACSVFMTGILLRWTLFHRLAPTHGYLHEPSGYPALIYDLVEPYRAWMEKAVMAAWRQVGDGDDKALVAASISILKDLLQEPVWIPAFQVETRRKNLLHAVVLALRAYLIGDMARFVVPVEGPRKGGRPIKASFRIPGAL